MPAFCPETNSSALAGIQEMNWKLEPQHTHLDLFRKRSAEHQGLSDAFVRHGVLFHDASYLWFKAHVQHAICLI